MYRFLTPTRSFCNLLSLYLYTFIFMVSRDYCNSNFVLVLTDKVSMNCPVCHVFISLKVEPDVLMTIFIARSSRSSAWAVNFHFRFRGKITLLWKSSMCTWPDRYLARSSPSSSSQVWFSFFAYHNQRFTGYVCRYLWVAGLTACLPPFTRECPSGASISFVPAFFFAFASCALSHSFFYISFHD